MFGLSREDYEETAWVWPENIPAVNMFVFLGTQWLVGPSGPYGVNYDRMWTKMDRMGLTPAQCEQMEDDIRTLEDAALEQMRKDQD